MKSGVLRRSIYREKISPLCVSQVCSNCRISWNPRHPWELKCTFVRRVLNPTGRSCGRSDIKRFSSWLLTRIRRTCSNSFERWVLNDISITAVITHDVFKRLPRDIFSFRALQIFVAPIFFWFRTQLTIPLPSCEKHHSAKNQTRVTYEFFYFFYTPLNLSHDKPDKLFYPGRYHMYNIFSMQCSQACKRVIEIYYSRHVI